jgi:hypothetical protein
LNRIFHQLDVLHADAAREHGDQSSVIVPEEVLYQDWRFQGVAISRISMLDPGINIPGPSLAILNACS